MNYWSQYMSRSPSAMLRQMVSLSPSISPFFVEFGAWDGRTRSTCCFLADMGWPGIFIECEDDRYDALCQNYKDNDKVQCLHTTVGIDDNCFDDVVAGRIPDTGIGVCSIDIDGLDLEVFEQFKKYIPTVVCIEGGQMLHPYEVRLPRKLASKNLQQSLSVMTSSFAAKGYAPVASAQNTYFVQEDHSDQFHCERDLLTLYFDGLRILPKRIPFIGQRNERNGQLNPIIRYVLKETEYSRFGWAKRKHWAKHKRERILEVLCISESQEREVERECLAGSRSSEIVLTKEIRRGKKSISLRSRRVYR